MSDQNVSRTVVVTDPAGVHARTAVAIAKAVRQGRSKVVLRKDDFDAEGTEVLQILSLGAPCGSKVFIEAVGPDAEEIVNALEPLFAAPEAAEADE
jgi:phosphotransferase system HPr (HPr) family protein